MGAIDRVLETVLYVDDLDAAERFYGEVLGLELDSKQDGLFVFFKCGAGHAAAVRAERGGHRPQGSGAWRPGPGHTCFAVAEADARRLAAAPRRRRASRSSRR